MMNTQSTTSEFKRQLTPVQDVPVAPKLSAVDDVNVTPHRKPVKGQKTILLPDRPTMLQTVWLENLATHHWSEIKSFPASIGRDEDCDVVLPGEGVSRLHASIEKSNGGFVIQDSGSLNGLYVNEHKLQRMLLADGDVIALGQSRLRLSLTRPNDKNKIGKNTSTTTRKKNLRLVWTRVLMAGIAVVVLSSAGLFAYEMRSSVQQVVMLLKQDVQSQSVSPGNADNSEVTTVAAAHVSASTHESVSDVNDTIDPLYNFSYAQAVLPAPGLGTIKPVMLTNKDLAPDITPDLNIIGTKVVTPATGKDDDSPDITDSSSVSNNTADTSSSYLIVEPPIQSSENITTAIAEASDGINETYIDKSLVKSDAPKQVVKTKHLVKSVSHAISKKQKNPQANKDTNAVASVLDTHIEQANLAYMQGDAETAFKTLEGATSSNSFSGEQRDLARQLVADMRQSHDAYIAGKHAFDNGKRNEAFNQWQSFLQREQALFLPKPSTYAKEVNAIVYAEYMQAGEKAYAETRYHEAYKNWQRAVLLDGKGKAASRLKALETHARDIYRDGYRMETANLARAKQKWQEVRSIVPPGNEYYTKATAKLRWYNHIGK